MGVALRRNLGRSVGGCCGGAADRPISHPLATCLDELRFSNSSSALASKDLVSSLSLPLAFSFPVLGSFQIPFMRTFFVSTLFSLRQVFAVLLYSTVN